MNTVLGDKREEAKQEFEKIILQIKEKQPENISLKNQPGPELINLQKILKTKEIIVKNITLLAEGKSARVEYAVKDLKEKNAKEKTDISFWNILVKSKSQWLLSSKIEYLKILSQKQPWRKIEQNRITFYFDYGIKKRTDEIMTGICERELEKIEQLLDCKAPLKITYFVCDDLKSLRQLGFSRSFSSPDSLVSVFPCDLFELINFIIKLISTPPRFLIDGFAVYYAKFVAKSSSDTLSFDSSHIDRMAKEVIFHAPYPSIKKILNNANYEENLQFLFIFTLLFTSKNQKINHDLILLSPPASFVKYLCEGDFSEIESSQRIKNMLKLLHTKNEKEAVKLFKELFGLKIKKAEKLWKKWLKKKK